MTDFSGKDLYSIVRLHLAENFYNFRKISEYKVGSTNEVVRLR